MINVGSEVRLQTVHGNFQGIVHGLNRREHFVSLRDAIDLSTGNKIAKPIRNFLDVDIRKCEVKTTDAQTGETVWKRNKFSSRLLMEMGLKDSSARVTRDSVSCDSLAAGTVLRENPTDDSTSAEHTPESASAAYVMLDKIDHSFHEAVGKIQHCGVIGLTGHGADLGRNGRLSLMQIATPECVYIFDMLWIGDRAFVEGLRDVLESKQTLKVMFNCRSMSDILWHQFAVNLTHVFDCQVAVVMLDTL